jgi:hypothetical protein
LHINEKNRLLVDANNKKSLWQEEEMHLLSANHNNFFHLLEPPPLLSLHEMKQHIKFAPVKLRIPLINNTMST